MSAARVALGPKAAHERRITTFFKYIGVKKINEDTVTN
jgi:hypothetical protein